MIRRPPRSTQSRSSAASDVYKRQIHSEPFTFWHTWKDQGLKSATFKLSLPAEFTEQMRFLKRIGMTRTDEVEIRGCHVRPRDVLLKVVSDIAKPTDVV